MSFLKKNSGYTLLEAILIIALILMLSIMTVPSLWHILPFLHSSTTVNQITKELELIRSRALADPDLHTGMFLDTTGAPDSIFTFFDNDNDNYFTPETDNLLSRCISLPATDTVIITEGYPDVIIFRGNGSAKLSANFQVKRGDKMSTTISVLASTGRIKTTINE